jgi:hypothetical protein
MLNGTKEDHLVLLQPYEASTRKFSKRYVIYSRLQLVRDRIKIQIQIHLILGIQSLKSPFTQQKVY